MIQTRSKTARGGTQQIRDDDKMVPILFDRTKWGLYVMTSENSLAMYYANVQQYVIRVPLQIFFCCQSIWRQIGISTIFWEHKEKDLQTELNKVHYFVGFAPYTTTPLCKSWVNDVCLKTVQNVPINDEVYVEIVLFTEALKDQMVKAISCYGDGLYRCRCKRSQYIYTVSHSMPPPQSLSKRT